ncbi:MAG: nascent polypeptide-associated complex protein [Candidatus Micrarchaeota archaeon]
MMPGMNPRQMQRMMQQMGIKSEDIKARRVIIELEVERMVIDNPQVTMVEMQGQKTYQIMGEARTESVVSSEDIRMVSEQTGVSEEEAKKGLEESNGDIAEAIMKLKQEQ